MIMLRFVLSMVTGQVQYHILQAIVVPLHPMDGWVLQLVTGNPICKQKMAGSL
jgi:hypothetical protein